MDMEGVIRQATPKTVKQSLVVWMDDGNVILQAGSTQFCVHRSLLTRNSSVFRDMFALPQVPSSDEDRDSEGRPIIRLEEQSSQLEHFLRAIYDRGYFRGNKVPWSVFETILRLSSKYMVDELHKEARGLFYHDFPDQLIDWNSREITTPITKPAGTASGEFRMPPESYLPWHVRAVPLARECGVFSVLPMAFYRLVRDVNIEHMFFLQDILSPSDFQTVLVGRERLRDKFTVAHPYFDHTSEDFVPCSDIACTLQRLKLGASLFQTNPLGQILEGKKSPCSSYTTQPSICRPCQIQCDNLYAAGRAEIWRGLPSLFSLPQWEELRRSDKIEDAVVDSPTLT